MTTGKQKIFLLKLRNNRGSVLLTVFLVITVLLALGVAFSVLVSNEKNASEAQRRITQAFYIAEAGVERALYDLKADFANSQDWTDGNISGMVIGPNMSNFYSIPYVSTTLSDGSYAVSLKNVAGADNIWIRSTGTIGSISQTILVYARIFNLSPWNNAIFGGAGSSGGWVNGNVNVSGSVHILGDGLDDGDNAIDLGGTAELVRNNYSILDAALKAKVPALPTTTFNGEVVETLNAELRVKNGIVGLSGSSSLGEPDNPGDGKKETVDGVYITDGYNGNKGADSVFSDNGTAQAYDLGDAVTFPKLSDPSSEDPAKTIQEYFKSQTPTHNNPMAVDLESELNNLTSASNFAYYHDSNLDGTFDIVNEDLDGDGVLDAGEDADSDGILDTIEAGISMDGSGNMVISGQIYVEGPVNIVGAAPISYRGTGTILAEGNVSITTNLVTAGINSFPLKNGVLDAGEDLNANSVLDAGEDLGGILGVMTPGEMVLGDSAQLDVMGLFYAQTKVTTDMQTILLGTIVANQFNITNQVPKIFQVPEAANNLPSGMIAGEPAYLMKVVSWQKIDNP